MGDQQRDGIVIESPSLAEELADIMERDMAPENAWRFSIDGEGQITWIAGDEVVTEQPARNVWQRVEDVFFMPFPDGLY